jgi:transcriptional regulator with XRE-family HTH domain
VTDQFNQIQMTLANRVRTLRKQHGLSQERLALEVGIDRTYQSQIERGIANPSLQVLCALATVLGITPADLINS